MPYDFKSMFTGSPRERFIEMLNGGVNFSTVVVEGDDTHDPIVLYRGGTNNARSMIVRRLRGSLASPAILNAYDTILEIAAESYDGSAYQQTALIRISNESASPAAGVMPADIVFLTSPTNTAGLVERFRIDNAGNFRQGGDTIIDVLRHICLRPYAISGLPAASSHGNKLAVVTDGTNGRRVVVSDGTVWRYLDGQAVGSIDYPVWKMLASSGAAATPHTGDTLEHTFATVVVPGGAMGANGILRISSLFSFTGTAGTHTARVRFGGSSVRNPTLDATQLSWNDETILYNRNSASAQAMRKSTGWFSSGAEAAGITTLSINTASDVNLTFGVTLGDAGDSCTLEAYAVELMYKA